MTLRLPYREPLHAASLLEFLGARTIAGVDEVTGDRYRRALRLPHGAGQVELAIRPGYAEATLHLADMRDLAPAVARCRRLLDLDADPVAVDAALALDPALAPSVAKEAGVRVPGAVDGFEIAVRAVVGSTDLGGRRPHSARSPRFRRQPATGERPGQGAARLPDADRGGRGAGHGVRHARGETAHAAHVGSRGRGRSAASRPRRGPRRDRGAAGRDSPASGRGPPSTSPCGRSATPTSCSPPTSVCAAARPHSACPTIRSRWPPMRGTGRPGARTRRSACGGTHDIRPQ